MDAPPATAAANFNRLARVYRALEFIAFGRDLERVRFAHVDRLRDCESILILGDGDGRFLARLLETSRAKRIHSIDASSAMLAAAAARISESDRSRVTFTCGDALACDFTPPAPRVAVATSAASRAGYDAVVTLFFLDCFSTPQVETLVSRIRPHLEPGARWLFGDFVTPERGWRRLRARLWLSILYTFFRWETGLRVNALPHSEAVLERAGFRPESSRTLQHGLLRATLYRMP